MVPRIAAARRVSKRSMTRWLSCINAIEVQGDVGGRIHPKTAPH